MIKVDTKPRSADDNIKNVKDMVLRNHETAGRLWKSAYLVLVYSFDLSKTKFYSKRVL